MKTDWQIPDILDLEYFLRLNDRGTTDPGQDRDIYVQHILPTLDASTPASRRHVIRKWLDRKRDMEKTKHPDSAFLPGETYSEIYGLLQVLFFIMAGITGWGTAAALLRYSGVQPVNIASYLGILVFFQVAILMITTLVITVHCIRPGGFSGSVLYGLIGRLAVFVSLKFRQKALKRLSAEKQGAVAATIGLLRGKRKIYGNLFFWPVFRLFQMFGVAFNIGALAGTLLRVLGTDLAFGWQSTLQFSAETVYNLVHTIAMPWVWLLPADLAHPTLAQVKGSHMVLKEGIYHLATGDLVAWWPFLGFAVAFYGLLPRILLFVFGIFRTRQSLNRIDFNHSDIDRLYQRFQTPHVSTRGEPSATNPEYDRPPVFPEQEAQIKVATIEDRQLVALIPDDIYDECPTAELRDHVQKALATHISEILRFGENIAADREIIQRLGDIEWSDQIPGVFILQEAWQPPIREFLTFLSNLREAMGERAKIEIGLVGRPRPETIFTPPSATDWHTWQRKLQTFGDPYLRLERLVPHE